MDYLLTLSWPTLILAFTLLMLCLYLAREPAHALLSKSFCTLYMGLRLVSRALSTLAKQLKTRNREVLFNLGREQTERELRKEFHEITQFVQRDLGGYPALQQDIRCSITQIQADYEASEAAPIAIPEWAEAVESIAKLKDDHHHSNTKVLEQIHQTAITQHKDNLKSNRENTQKRHSHLQKLLPYWRKLSFSIDDTGKHLIEIEKRASHIDTHMSRFEEIHQQSDKALRMLHMSTLTQFLVSALVIVIAAGGAFFNFHLIALPMSEMVGSVQRVGGVKVSDLAALVIICMEMCAGIFLLESLRITKLFPLIGSMDDRTRRVIMVTSLTVLLTLACTESALAFMRDQIANELSELRSSLAGLDLTSSEVSTSSAAHWIPLAANMVLGFILPIALTMIAIPLEYLLQSGRNIIAQILVFLLSTIAVTIRLLANCARHLGKISIAAYDFLIAGPLFIEGQALKFKTKNATPNTDWLGVTQSIEAQHAPKGERV